jgi:hypothetical protein
LDKIELLLFEHGRKLLVGAGGVMRHADIANSAVILPLPQRGQMRPPIDEIVYLHQVDALRSQAPERFFHLPDARIASAGPNFGGDKELVVKLQFGREIPDDAFRLAIHR